MSLSFKEKRIKVRERDGNNCWLCGKHVQEGLIDGNPLMATLDHVVKVSKDGSNRLHNLKLAHAKCNNDRSNSPRSNRLKVNIFSNYNHSDLIQYINRVNSKFSESVIQ